MSKVFKDHFLRRKRTHERFRLSKILAELFCSSIVTNKNGVVIYRE